MAFPNLSYKVQLQHWLKILAFLLILSSCTSAPSGKASPTPTPKATPRPFIDTWNNIHLFQTFDYGISDPAAVARHYDFVWGANLENVKAWHLGNPHIFVTYYIPFQIDWGTFPDPNTRHGLAYWKKVHPDWILYQCDRTTPAYDKEETPLNFADPAFASWEIETYAKPASQAGYDGIAVDNLTLGNRYHACGVYIHGKWVKLYTGQYDDPVWRANIIGWLARMQQALHNLPHPLALIPNTDFNVLSPSDPQFQQLVNHVDGILDEGGFTNYGSNYYLTGGDWTQRIQIMINTQKQHKPYFVISLFPAVSHEQIQWALASYLMGKDHTASLFVSTPDGYGSDVLYAEYNAQIGTPLGPMYHVQHVYFRSYSHGLSIANPSATTTYRVKLDTSHSYRDLYGNAVNQIVTLPPHSGLVLLYSS